MKKAAYIFIIGLLISWTMFAQTGQSTTGTASNVVAAGIHIPFGEFGETHLAGISLNYSWSQSRFGRMGVLPKKLIGFTTDAGIDYYLGKKEKTAGYYFKYGGYTYLHVAGGIIYNPCKKGNISLTTGPSVGIYKGSGNVGFRVGLNGSYYLNTRLGLSPGVIFIKHREANALWAATLMASYNF